MLALVYLTKPGQVIFRSALHQFRTDTLDKDDVFHPTFLSNFVFYGSKKEALQIKPEAMEELAAWNTKTLTFIEGNPAFTIAPDPYVFAQGRTWQPWKIYDDHNGIFMCTFKPSSDRLGR